MPGITRTDSPNTNRDYFDGIIDDVRITPGTASFQGNNDFITIPEADFNFGNGSFTVENRLHSPVVKGPILQSKRGQEIKHRYQLDKGDSIIYYNGNGNYLATVQKLNRKRNKGQILIEDKKLLGIEFREDTGWCLVRAIYPDMSSLFTGAGWTSATTVTDDQGFADRQTTTNTTTTNTNDITTMDAAELQEYAKRFYNERRYRR